MTGMEAPEILFFIFVFFLLMIYVCLLSYFFGITRRSSKRYRKTIADMYVIGKIKQIAEKDNIDLKKELSEFIKVMKDQRKFVKDYDEIVEKELDDKVFLPSK